ncbi:ADP compounds hydrolase NudE [Psittacicella melopsittaci]|uniref:ADP compounds hydrolase NudE n=1 Tax=Psittacicella melopsittaci TaxID=2028576 RepID=A0A3A1Y1P1_9GAMM|nr:ADP compounds hydrolase NudE [Psittacicella melopsittaci]RIY31371.1 ADP compounds hydrolase NudE [Psittacicella melopsittaci]
MSEKKDFPQVSNLHYLGKLGIFHVESVHLRFSNGEQREYFRLASRRDAVTVIAIEQDHLLCVREFAGGTLQYELGFVRGGVEQGETPIEAAIRELGEEVGYKANKVVHLSTTSSSPGYNTGFHHIVLATELEQLPVKPQGDEPEPLELIRWPLNDLAGLLEQKHFRDTTHTLAVFALQAYLANNALAKALASK